MLHPFIANTDRAWFEFLSSRAQDCGGPLDEVNFWQPQAQRPMAKLPPGTPVFFRLRSPTYAIAGYGFFASFILLGLEQAWEHFGAGNGDPDRVSFLTRIGGYRKTNLLDPRTPTAPLGCTILRDAVYWPPDRWIRWDESMGWAPNIVQGKREADPVRASRLLAEIQYDRLPTPAEFEDSDFVPLEVDEREIVLARDRPRVGQGAFRSPRRSPQKRPVAVGSKPASGRGLSGRDLMYSGLVDHARPRPSECASFWVQL